MATKTLETSDQYLWLKKEFNSLDFTKIEGVAIWNVDTYQKFMTKYGGKCLLCPICPHKLVLITRDQCPVLKLQGVIVRLVIYENDKITWPLLSLDQALRIVTQYIL
jgi:hypothetical protein